MRLKSHVFHFLNFWNVSTFFSENSLIYISLNYLFLCKFLQKIGKEGENSYGKIKRFLMKVTHKHGNLIEKFIWSQMFFRLGENKCIWTCKDGALWEFLKSTTRELQDRKGGGVEGMEEKINGNYLMLIPGLCLEDKTNS